MTGRAIKVFMLLLQAVIVTIKKSYYCKINESSRITRFVFQTKLDDDDELKFNDASTLQTKLNAIIMLKVFRA